MGKIKLTLSVEENIIIKAKQIAQVKKQSLSNIFEKLLVDNLIGNQSVTSNNRSSRLRGIAKSEISNKTEKEIRDMMINEKYGI